MSTDGESQSIKIHPSWLEHLAPEFEQPYMKDLKLFLRNQIANKVVVHPKPCEWFAALNAVPFGSVRVVILGQDPYHGDGQAHGLSFSVPEGVKLPPSLVNIYKELYADLGVVPSRDGSLFKWARQGVLLLNSVLTVESGLAASHQGKGWERFTDRIIETLAKNCQGLVFVLWGSYAQKKASFVDHNRHKIISSAHPSPLSAHRGFLGSRPFSKINDYLRSKGETIINW